MNGEDLKIKPVQKVAVAGIEPFTVYSASFTGLAPGSKFHVQGFKKW